MSRHVLALAAAGSIGLAGLALAAAADKEPSKADNSVIATVNGEPVTKTEWKTIMDADKWHGPTLKAEPSYVDRMSGKPFEDFFFREEVVKIRVMAQKYKDVLPQMKTTIDEVYQKAKAGEDFSELAQKYSQDASAAHGGSIGGPKELKDMVFPFNRVALSMKPGEISEPVQTIFGYHVIKVEKVLPASPGEGKGKTVELRHVLIKYPSTDAKAESENLASQAKVEVLDKSLCKKLPSWCAKEG